MQKYNFFVNIANYNEVFMKKSIIFSIFANLF